GPLPSPRSLESFQSFPSFASSEHVMRLVQRLDQPVDLFERIIHGKGGPCSGGDAIAREKRLGTMGTRPDGDAVTVENGADIVRMRALHLKGDDRAPVLGVAKDAQPVELAEALHSVGEEPILMRLDALAPDAFHIVDGGTEPDGLHDGRRAGFEAVRRWGIGDALGGYRVDHLAAALIGPHGLEQLLFAVKHADAGRAVKLMSGEGIEIAIEVLNIDREMHRALGAVDQHGDAA